MSQITSFQHASQVRDACAAIEAELAALPEYDYTRRAPYLDAVNRATERLAQGAHRIRVTVRCHDHAVTAHGLRASSTGGAAAALRNWITQARQKADAYERQEAE